MKCKRMKEPHHGDLSGDTAVLVCVFSNGVLVYALNKLSHLCNGRKKVLHGDLVCPQHLKIAISSRRVKKFIIFRMKQIVRAVFI